MAKATQEIVVSVYDAKAVELKPGSKYLLLLRGDIAPEELDKVSKELKRLGFDALTLAIPSGMEVSIIEQPAEVPDVSTQAEESKEAE